MYPEFVAIYIMLGVIIVVLAVVIFLLIKLMKNGVSTSASSNPYIPPVQPVQPMNDHYYQQPQYQAPQYQMQYPQQPASNIVYCKQCSGQFDASQAYCPHCGARR